MKSKFLILSAVILVAGCQSSDKLLDVVSPTTVSDDIFWTQEADAQLFVTGTYSALPGWFDVMVGTSSVKYQTAKLEVVAR